MSRRQKYALRELCSYLARSTKAGFGFSRSGQGISLHKSHELSHPGMDSTSKRLSSFSDEWNSSGTWPRRQAHVFSGFAYSNSKHVEFEKWRFQKNITHFLGTQPPLAHSFPWPNFFKYSESKTATYYVPFVPKNSLSTENSDSPPPKTDVGGDPGKENSDSKNEEDEVEYSEKYLQMTPFEPPFLCTNQGDDIRNNSSHSDVEAQYNTMEKLRSSISDWAMGLFLRTFIERSFNLNDFLECAKEAYLAVISFYWKGDFESLKKCVSPRILATLQKSYKKIENRGIRMEYEIKSVRSKLIYPELSLERHENEGYRLSSNAVKIEDYHNEVFCIFVVRFNFVMKMRIVGYDDNVVQDTFHSKQVIKFARQLPMTPKFANPVDEMVSPWIIASMHD